MTADRSFLTLEEVLAAQRSLSQSAYHNLWRVTLYVLAWGSTATAVFLAATWLSSYIEPIKSARIYWLAGVTAFVIFGSWPLIDFLHAFFVQRKNLASLEARVRGGESVPRPNPSSQRTAYGGR